MNVSVHSPMFNVQELPANPAVHPWVESAISRKFELPVYGKPMGKLPKPAPEILTGGRGWRTNAPWLFGVNWVVADEIEIGGELSTEHAGLAFGGPAGKTAQLAGPVMGLAVVGRLVARG